GGGTGTASTTTGAPGATPTPTEVGGEPTETATRGVPAATATATEIGAERTETATPETGATPTAPATCAGGCGGNHDVSIFEMLSGVNIALGQRPIGSCSAVDGDGDGEVHINELIAAVSRALQGC